MKLFIKFIIVFLLVVIMNYPCFGEPLSKDEISCLNEARKVLMQERVVPYDLKVLFGIVGKYPQIMQLTWIDAPLNEEQKRHILDGIDSLLKGN